MDSMHKIAFTLPAVCLLTLSVIAPAAQDYPYQPVPFTQVHFSDAFWLPRIETNRTATIPFAFKQSEETGRIENFKVAAKLSGKPWQGDFGFNDSDVYKIIEGASYSLMVHPDPKLDAYLDELIGWIAAAQEPDGYLYTAWTAQARKDGRRIACCYDKERWDNIRDSHELYNLGHMYEAAAAHFLSTGKRSFLDIAVKSADLVCSVFNADHRLDPPGHQEIEIGLVKLYRATGQVKYLNQAKFFLDMRGRNADKRRLYGAYSQDHKPVVEQTEAVGHAVRAAYMYSGMADVAALTGDAAYVKAIDTIWDNVVSKKLYLTGGIGARHAGEAFGDNYELPNRSAYCETCAAIANVYWNHRMFLLHGKADYIDVMELSLYNNVLSGVALNGMLFFYPNPLESAAGHDRQPWFGCACCPSNISRFLASVPGYVYAVRDDAVYVNLFVNSDAEIAVAGKKVKFTQATDYPRSGAVTLTVAPETEGRMTLNLRIPGWAQNKPVPGSLYAVRNADKQPVKLTVNGAELAVVPVKGYAVIDREWKAGDTLTLTLPMPVQRMVCDERVKDNVGKVALQRGPLVYCLEGHDVQEGRVLNLMLPDDAALTPDYNADLLGGLAILKGTAMELSRSLEGTIVRTPRAFSAIPYYAWAHRGRTPMAVWLPRTEEAANPLPAPTIASQSKVSTSFQTNVGNARLEFVQDQRVPASSGDAEQGYVHWWPHKGVTEWIQYDFNGKKEVSETAVYWFDDTGRGECRIPKAWNILYRDGDTWKPVEAAAYTITLDAFDRVRFTPVATEALRLEITFQENVSSGIQEWTVQ
jgi:hypothetical protein